MFPFPYELSISFLRLNVHDLITRRLSVIHSFPTSALFVDVRLHHCHLDKTGLVPNFTSHHVVDTHGVC